MKKNKEKEQLEKFKKMPFGEKVDMVGRMLRKGFKKAGITKRDIPRLIKEVREEKHKAQKEQEAQGEQKERHTTRG